jgi:hypothetical protein
VKCNTRRLSVLDIVDADHAWAKNGGFVEIRCRSKNAKGQLLHEALRLCCELHLKVSKTKQQLGKYVVASIHFSVPLLNGKHSRNDPLTEEEARYFDSAAGYPDSRLKDDLNKIGRRLESRFEKGNTDNGKPISEMLKDQISGLFVQAPVHPGYFVDSFINERVESAARKRSERRSVAQTMATIPASIDDEDYWDAGRSYCTDSMEVENIGGSASLELHFDPNPNSLVNTPPAKVAAPATTPEVYNLAIAHRYLNEKFISMNRDVNMFCSNQRVQKFTKLVFLVEGGTLVKLDDNTFMVKCSDAVQEGCQLFKILKSAPSSSGSLCDFCSQRHKTMRQRKQRRSRSNTDRTEPSSRAPISTMSPLTLRKKVKTTKMALVKSNRSLIEKSTLTFSKLAAVIACLTQKNPYLRNFLS